MTHIPYNTRAAAQLGEWLDDARCAGTPDFTEWPLTSQRVLCGPCPVRAQCIRLGVESARGVPTGHVLPHGGLRGSEVQHLARAERSAS